MEGSYRELVKLTEKFPGHAGSLSDLGLHLEERGDVEGDVEKLKAVLKANPYHAPALHSLVAILPCRH